MDLPFTFEEIFFAIRGEDRYKYYYRKKIISFLINVWRLSK